MATPLLVDTTDHVRTLTLHRPERRNALDADLLRRLVAALRAADDDPRAVRAVNDTYTAVSELALGEGLDVEEQRMRGWQVDVEGFEGRRRAVTDRGRAEAGARAQGARQR